MASKRWIALLIASVLLHVVAFNWAEGRIGMPAWHDPKQTVITTELHPAPAPVPPAPKPVASPPKPKPKPKKAKPHRRVAPSPPPVAETVPAPSALTQPVPEPVDTDASAAGEPGSNAGTGTVSGEAESAPPVAAAPSYKFNPPPSAELSYDVQVLQKGQTWYGSGVYRWEATNDRYRATIEAGMTIIFRITALNSTSEGKINDLGLAPELYTEKPWRKSMTNTHFQHANHKISFSASEAVYPYNGGEQDRASVVWQLAGIGRGGGEQFAPGAEFDLVVAGPRDADNWHFRVIGEELADTPDGKQHAWHVRRVPAAGTYDETFDFWFAPQLEWYPVRVRKTYASGDYYDLVLTRIEPAAAH
ncbi:MAG TPA: DUF3108 domain-containing protein [Noviherbaspirillum sp.]|nr:DUF3108 domain-containing protein [Noviherbaspirillum sp.]